MSYLRTSTPVEDRRAEFGLLIKREDLSCSHPGPPFSKTRGVLPHVQKQYDQGVRLFGVLDTSHSQAGHAVAQACNHLGARCVNYFPVYKADTHSEQQPGDLAIGFGWVTPRPPQAAARNLGAVLHGLPAGRSAILFHQAKKLTLARGGYIMPNALKLPEMVEETADEVSRTLAQLPADAPATWVVAASSGTIAAGVLCGLSRHLPKGVLPNFIIHMGYDRSEDAVRRYISEKSGLLSPNLTFVQEGYSYADKARPGPTPPWPCNQYYDLKAFRWWMREGRARYGSAVLWNIG